jgi:hypothetical protein
MRLEYVIHVGDPYLGAHDGPAEWTFKFGRRGNVIDFNLEQSADEGDYANVVVSGGEGDGAERLMSTSGIAQDSAALDFGWPLVEHRSATQLKTRAAVDADALGQLAHLKDGTDTISVTAKTDALDLTSSMFGLGDQCRIVIEPGTPSVPDGFDGLARITGWSIDPQNDEITPTLVTYERIP